VEQVDSNKPLSIALEEIAAEKIIPHYPGDAHPQADAPLNSEMLPGDDLGGDIISFGGEEEELGPPSL
jgi:hypothetical protein